MTCWQPLVRTGPRVPGGLPLAGGWTWFTDLILRERGRPPEVVPVTEAPDDALDRLTEPRPDIVGLTLDAPRVMAVLNVTPDSFSDGGRHAAGDAAIAQARRLIDAGADILDIGGESTRPGAVTVPEAEEEARVVPVIAGIRAFWGGPVSIDTRKAPVAAAAVTAGATILNDVSALTHDAQMAATAAALEVPVCLMHAQGGPAHMQDAPAYEDVLLDVHDHLAARVAAAEAAGIPRARIVVDPGIGFGKTLAHNLTLLRNLSLFHAIGVPVLLGASRKGFIGTLADEPDASARMPGSVAVALAGIAQGVQFVRVHDMEATRQAIAVWRAVTEAAP